jgi:hypothetical protein
VVEMSIINESLKHCVGLIRQSKFLTFDHINQELIDQLRVLPGVESFEDLKKDIVLFSFPLTNMVTSISYPLNGFTLKELVKDENKEIVLNLTQSFKSFVELLKNLEHAPEVSRLEK